MHGQVAPSTPPAPRAPSSQYAAVIRSLHTQLATCVSRVLPTLPSSHACRLQAAVTSHRPQYVHARPQSDADLDAFEHDTSAALAALAAHVDTLRYDVINSTYGPLSPPQGAFIQAGVDRLGAMTRGIQDTLAALVNIRTKRARLQYSMTFEAVAQRCGSVLRKVWSHPDCIIHRITRGRGLRQRTAML